MKEYLDEQLAMNAGFPSMLIFFFKMADKIAIRWNASLGKPLHVPWFASVAAIQDNTLCVGGEMWYRWNAAHMTILRVTSTSGILSMLVVAKH